jgi:TctA family transporter
MCPEPAHPHGVVGYTLADPGRTRNALRLARWAVLALAIVAAAVVALALFSPLEAAGALPTGVAGRGRAIVWV